MPRRQVGGFAVLKKTAGQTGAGLLTSGQQINIPILSAEPSNPTNTMRMETINKIGTLNQSACAKKTPSIRIVADAKASWLTAALVNSMLNGSDTNGNSDEFTIILNDGTADRQYQGAKLVNLQLAVSPSPTIRVIMDFVAIRGESDVSSATTYTTPTTDYSASYCVTDVSWGASATATDVLAASINLTKIQVPQYFADGSLFASKITSGPVRGSVLLQQDPDAATKPTTGLTLRIGASTTGIQIALALGLDNIVYPLEAGPANLGVESRMYTVADSASAAGVVCAITTW